MLIYKEERVVYPLFFFSFIFIVYDLEMIMIDKCFGGNCPLKQSCKRYTDPKISDVQSVMYPPYFINEEFSCEKYWGNSTEIIIFNLELFFKNQEKLNTKNAY